MAAVKPRRRKPRGQRRRCSGRRGGPGSPSFRSRVGTGPVIRPLVNANPHVRLPRPIGQSALIGGSRAVYSICEGGCADEPTGPNSTLHILLGVQTSSAR